MGSFGNYVEDKVLDAVFGQTALPSIATVYVALYTATPSDANASGTEVSGGSYARVAVTNNTTNWPNSSGGAKANGAAVTFPAPTGNWGTVTHFAIYDASTAGNELAWGALTTSRVINNGDGPPSFAIGDIDITLD